MAEDPRIEQIRAVLTNHTDPFGLFGHQGRGLERIRAIVNGGPPDTGAFPALLNRLADLTEAAGKQRSTEWLRTCATLPMEEWPPAPAHKGPMVPAAELDEMTGFAGEQSNARREADRERDALQARLDRVGETVEAAATGIAIGMATNPARWECAEAAIEDVRAALQGDQPAEPEVRGG